MVTLFSFWPAFSNSIFTAGDSFSFPFVMAEFERFNEHPVSFKKSKIKVHNFNIYTLDFKQALGSSKRGYFPIVGASNSANMALLYSGILQI
jgi:hypothetical protein